MTQSTHQTRDTGRVADFAGDLKERTAAQIDQMAGQVEGAAKAVREQGREMGEQVQVVADNSKPRSTSRSAINRSRHWR